MAKRKRREVRADELMAWLVNWYHQHGYLPVLRTIAEAMGCGTTTIHATLKDLENQGKVIRGGRYGPLAFPPEHVRSLYVGPGSKTFSSSYTFNNETAAIADIHPPYRYSGSNRASTTTELEEIRERLARLEEAANH